MDSSKNDALPLHGHNAGNGNALFLSAGQIVRRTARIFGHADFFERLIDAFPDFLRRKTEVFTAERHVFLDNRGDDLVVRILENHPDIPSRRQNIRIGHVRRGHFLAAEPELSRVGVIDHAQELGQCGLTAPVMTENGGKGAFFNFKGHIVQGTYRLAVGIGRIRERKMFGFYDGSFLHKQYHPVPGNSESEFTAYGRAARRNRSPEYRFRRIPRAPPDEGFREAPSGEYRPSSRETAPSCRS